MLGSHGAGPFWMASDGSRVIGQVEARTDAPLAGAIPWLLLTTMSNGGPGAMAALNSVQRLQTVGGAAPVEGGATAADAGEEARVPCTAHCVHFVRG